MADAAHDGGVPVSVRVQSRVWERSAATGNAFVVLLKIADNCDDHGRNAWPSIDTLACYCRCSRSTVKRCIAELVALGELEVTAKAGGRNPGTRYSPNLYRVLLDERGQSEPSGAGGGSNSASRGFKSGDSAGSAVSPEPSIDPSRTASGADLEVRAAHLRIARESLGVLQPDDDTRDGNASQR